MEKSNHDLSVVEILGRGKLGEYFEKKEKKILFGFFENFNSLHTRSRLKRDLKQFLEFLKENFPGLDILSVDHDHATAFKNYLDFLEKTVGEKRYSKETVNQKLTSISSFYLYLCRRNICDKNPFGYVKRHFYDPENKTNDFSDAEVQLILKKLKSNSLSSSLHKALIMTLLATGMRNSEIRFLRRKNLIKYGEYWVFKFLSKGEKERTTPLPKQCVEAIFEYISKRENEFGKISPNDFLFLPSLNTSVVYENKVDGLKGPLSSSTILYVVKKYVRLAGIDRKLTPHSFRATTIGSLLENGNDLAEVCDWIGHCNVNTTKRYSKRKIGLEKSMAFSMNFFQEEKNEDEQK